VKVLTSSQLRCPETGKTAYAERARAPRAAYLCSHCGWWHVYAKGRTDGAKA
jgi:predicted RNA-binding Zn-ribbon protein involved in translation (DUF1610 family)